MTTATVPARVGPPAAVARRAPWALALVAAILVGGGFGLGVHLSNLHNGVIALAFTAVGVFVLASRPGNRQGWLFIATGEAHAVMFAGRQYGLDVRDGGALPGADWVSWAGVWPLALVLALVGITFLCFPDGRLPSPRWRPVVVAMVATGALLSAASALWPVEYADNSLSLPHPLDTAGYQTAQRVWTVAGPASYLLFQFTWVLGVVVRMRRAEGDEARQLRWFVYAVVATAAVMVAGLVTADSPVPGVLSVPLVAVAAGAAIVKYRLYDIDLVISKTLVVGAMAVAVTAAYVLVVVGVGRLVGLSAGADPTLSLVATALIAIAFEPARRRVQRWSDRLVHGRRTSPYEALARLSSQLSSGGREADLFTGLASTVADGVGAGDVTLWVGSDGQLAPVACWPPATPGTPPAAPQALASLADEGRVQVRPILHQGSLRGAVTLTKPRGEALTPTEDRLLRDLLAQAGIVIELQAAARRIVAAQDEARQRIERDLHDGAQQRLVTLALSLQTVAERARAGGDADLAGRVEEARAQLGLALAELREMARGIHPAVLTQDGLEAALDFLAERASLPVRLDVRLDRRLARDVEATAYFVVSEALANAAKHSGASRVAVSCRVRDGRLSVEVADDGRGGADDRRGSGLQGLVDRLATAGGRLVVHSPVGGGTRLRAEIPCG